MHYNKRYILLISLVVALGGFLLGFDSAVICGAIPFMSDYFSLNELQTGWTVSSFIIGVIIGNALSGPLSDRIGRKKILMMTAVLFAVSAIASAVAYEFWFLFIAVYDTGPERETIGYAFSGDGYTWRPGNHIVFTEGKPAWRSTLRTPLCFLPEDKNIFTIFYTAFNSKGFIYNEEPKHHSGFGTVGRIKVKLHE